MPILSSPEINVNTTTAGNQVDPAILVLDNGNTVIAWTDGSAVYAQQYSQLGVAVGSEIVIGSGLTGSRDAGLTKTASGGFVVTWSQTVGASLDVMGRVYNDAGAPVAAAANLLSSPAADQINSTTATLPDGNIVLVWTEAGSIGTRVWNPVTGLFVSTAVTTTDLVPTASPDIVVLADGSFVVSYASPIAGSNEIVAQKYNADGTTAGSVFSINVPVAGNQSEVKLTALAAGGFVAVWHLDGGSTITMRKFSDDGSLVSSEVVVNAGTTLPKNANVAELADGRIVVVWEAGTDIYSRYFDANGAPLSGDILVNQSISGTQADAKIVALSDGRFTITYTSTDATGAGIRSTTLDPNKFIGTSVADLWKGGSANETMYGNDGADDLFGNGGNDIIIGGAMADTMDGGIGDDTLQGDAGADTLKGGEGNDKLYAGNGDLAGEINTLDGGLGDDIMYAGSGINKFDGDLGSDTISYFYQGGVNLDFRATATTNTAKFGTTGAAVGDQLVVGQLVENIEGSSSGADTIYGSTLGNVIKTHGGNDTVRGGSGLDKIYGGSGNDNLMGEVDNDILFGDAGNDIIDGGAGNDTIFSGLGADTLAGGTEIDTLSYYYETSGATMSITSGTGSGSAAGDTSTGFENLYGSNSTASGDVLTGNTLANILKGYAGNDVLNGGTGIDSLDGGLGNDTLNGGSDADKLSGGGGDDFFYGSTGKDSYSANASGKDTFYFASASDYSTGVETINTFNFGSTTALGTLDKIQFADAGFTGLSAGPVTSAMLLKTTTGLHAATTAAHRFIFDDKNNTLYYDNDGVGGAAEVAVIKFGVHTGSFDFNDFQIV